MVRIMVPRRPGAGVRQRATHSSLDTLEWRPQGDLDGRLGMSLVGGRESETEWAVRCGHQSSMLRCFAMQLACCWVPRLRLR